jgi:A/G-specific adenine glycosylase
MPAVAKQLWCRAESYTPDMQVAEYTQAIMDLGATVCTRSNAKCDLCPMTGRCQAYIQGRVAELPARKPGKELQVRKKRLLVIQNEKGELLMEKRPPAGIWGGLWSLPELEMEQQVEMEITQNWHLSINEYNDLPVFRHTFSHFHLDITPCLVRVRSAAPAIAETGNFEWCKDVSGLAMSAPVSSILQKLTRIFHKNAR